jgi:hypothetical protein
MVSLPTGEAPPDAAGLPEGVPDASGLLDGLGLGLAGALGARDGASDGDGDGVGLLDGLGLAVWLGATDGATDGDGVGWRPTGSGPTKTNAARMPPATRMPASRPAMIVTAVLMRREGTSTDEPQAALMARC